MWSLRLFVVVVDDSWRYGTMLKLWHHRTFMHPRIKISMAGFSSQGEKIEAPPTPRNSTLDWALTFCYLEKHLGFRAIPTSKSFVMVFV